MLILNFPWISKSAKNTMSIFLKYFMLFCMLAAGVSENIVNGCCDIFIDVNFFKHNYIFLVIIYFLNLLTVTSCKFVDLYFLDLWDNEKYFYPWPSADLSGICRPFHLSDLEDAMAPSPVRKVVFIQVNQTYDETGKLGNNFDSVNKGQFINRSPHSQIS